MDFVILQTTERVPLSAYAICYAPLAIMIIGIITFFAMTDWHARRRYLRLNPFLVTQLSAEKLAQRPLASGETPAGALGAAPAGEATTFSGEDVQVVASQPLPSAPDPETLDQEADVAAALEQGDIGLAQPDARQPILPGGEALQERPDPDKPQPLDRPPTPDEQV